MRRRLWFSVTFCLLGSCGDSPPAAPARTRSALEPGAPLAKIAKNTIDPVGVLAKNGVHLQVTGPIACTAGESVELRVTVTQRTTGAVGDGGARITCTGNDQIWRVQLQKTGRETFEPGAAVAVAFARTSFRGQVTDAHQWLVDMKISE